MCDLFVEKDKLRITYQHLKQYPHLITRGHITNNSWFRNQTDLLRSPETSINLFVTGFLLNSGHKEKYNLVWSAKWIRMKDLYTDGCYNLYEISSDLLSKVIIKRGTFAKIYRKGILIFRATLDEDRSLSFPQLNRSTPLIMGGWNMTIVTDGSLLYLEFGIIIDGDIRDCIFKARDSQEIYYFGP